MENRNLNEILKKYLSKFESIVDPEYLNKVQETCQDIFEFRKVKDLPFILNDTSKVIDTDWPTFPYNDGFKEPAKMLLNQLHIPFLHHQLRDFHALNIRCNYGTVILPSIFGVEFQLTENSMPWCHHFNSRTEIEKLISKGIPKFENGLGKSCFETAQYYMKVLSDYPKLKKTVTIYHPDLQGPFDVAHLIWGADIFIALYDCPDLVHKLLSLITETYQGWMREWKKLVNEGNQFTTHWEFYIKGGIMIRDDTPVMLSPQQYDEFVKPYDQILLDEFGGCIHFCGKGDHFIKSICKSENLFGIHCSQPELNDIELLTNSTLSNKIGLIGLPKKYVTNHFKTGIILLD